MSKRGKTTKEVVETTKRRPAYDWDMESLDEELMDEEYYVSDAILNSLRPRKEMW